MSRKLLSWILILSMIFSLCSVPAFAEAENGEDEQIEDVLDEDPGIPSDNEEETASSADDQASDDGDLTEDDQISDDQSNEELSASPDDPAAEAEPLPGSAESDQLDSTDPSTEGGEEFISEDDEALSSENNGITPDEADCDLPEEADRSISVDEAADDDADEPDEILYGEVCVTVPGTDSGGQDSDALLSGYFDLLVRGGNGGNRGSAAGDLLAGSEAILYSFLAEKIDLVAKGQLSSTEFSILASSLNLTRSSWSISELGLEDDPIFDSEGYLTDASMRALDAALGEVLSTSSVNSALLADYPFELFWYDKTSGYHFNYYIIYDGESLGIDPDGDFTVRFYVADEYAVESFSTNTELIQSVQNAASNARSIVSAYSSNSDRAKLMGYLTEICSRVSYNYDALEPNVSYGNPWQLIWVFDGDTETNVVCEGYSKAFQYLCDLSSFESNLVRCLSVSGSMGGPHMWNVVRLADGINYLVDVTNCDSSMIGEPDKLFLAVPTSGDLDDGYTFTANGYQIGYTYDAETLATFSREDLVIGETEQRQIIDSGSCGAQGDNLTWTLYDDGELVISGTGAMDDYYYSVQPQPWKNYLTQIKSIELPNGITNISNMAFFGCSALESIIIPFGVVSIGEMAFMHCNSLSSIAIPNSVVSIDSAAFSACLSLTSVTLSQNITIISDSAFDSCFELSSITIPDGVTTIGSRAFACCSSLMNLTIPNSVTRIESEAFFHCNSITSVTIPENVNWIGSIAFSDCISMTDIYVSTNNPTYASVDGVLFSKNLHSLITYPAGKRESYIIPTEVNYIYNYAFRGCENLSSVIIPDGVSRIGSGVFEGCTSLTSVSIPEGITSIGTQAFMSCTSLTSIFLPYSLCSIGTAAFAYCNSLTNVYYAGIEEQRSCLEDNGWESEENSCLFNASWTYHQNHFWSNISYVWADNNNSVIASRTCPVCGENETETVSTSYNVITAPSCEIAGVGTYTASFENTAFSTQTKEVTIDATGHAWGEPSFSWAEDGNSTVSRRICVNNASHIEEIIASIERVIDTKPSYLADGSMICTATAVFDGVSYSDTQSFVISNDNWSVVDGKVYYSDVSGKHVTGWQQFFGDWYYFGSDGVMSVGWKQVGSKWYYFSDLGVMQTGLQQIGGKTYYFLDSGTMFTGWKEIDGTWYYFLDNGAACVGWKQVGSKWYYFGEDGAMYTGLQTIGGKLYYFENSGAMATGWKQIDGNWYYFLANGSASTGLKDISGKQYCFNAEGVMQTGFQQIDGRTYFFNDNGSMFTGWKEIGGVWYYFLDNGAAATGWKQVGSKWYYFGEDGAMYTGLQMIGEKKYFFLDNGSMVTGWKQIDGTWYYFLDNGAACIGWKKLGSSWYYFDSDGSMLANTSRTIGSKVYYFAENGVCLNP